MRHLHLDIETYSSEPIANGVYRYASAPDFTVLLMAYAWDSDPVGIIDFTDALEMERGDLVWKQVADWLTDPDVVKHAHNATFERVCLTVELRRRGWLGGDEWLDPGQWDCSMIQCARCGLPLSLDEAGRALGLERRKMSEGKALIQLFCLPRKQGGGLFVEPDRVDGSEQPDKWRTFRDYCARDVDVERQITRRLAWYDAGDRERGLYATDQRINDRGVLVDTALARNAVMYDTVNRARLTEEAMRLTGLANPNSRPQLLGWLASKGVDSETLTKTDVANLLASADDPDVRRVLQIRAEVNKTSNSKYQTMLDMAGEDGRVRGLMQFYGTRTGRWAGRGVQMQNLPQNHIGALDEARTYLLEGDWDMLELGFGNVPDTLSQLIRTAFVAKPGCTLAVCDFSAIEARVLAWLAGEDWVLDVFRKGGDIYCETASQMFGVPVEKHGRNAHLRQKGKVSVLALGYQGGVGALDKMGGRSLGMTEDEERETVQKWRGANPRIVAFWRMVEDAAKECCTYREDRTVETPHCTVTMRMEGDTMTVELPSGRRICYPEMETFYNSEWAYLGQTEAQKAAGAECIVKERRARHPERYLREAKLRFMGVDQTTKKWGWIETYGGKMTENITQAVARDCLAEVMTACEQRLLPVVFHVHDELVMEVPEGTGLADIERIFSVTPEWAAGLPLKGAGYMTRYYKKD